jgi:penicillin G amidase
MRTIPIALFILIHLPMATLAQDKYAKNLAQIDGEIRVPGLKEPVEVLRDQWGVPHIYAKNADDLFFAQGFVAAQDRLFQLDLWRRLAVGETAEVLGPQAIDADHFARLIRYRGDMDAEWRSYSPDTKRIATAFTSGINAWIDQTAKRLPIEFQVLGFAPKKWQPEDILGRMSGIVMSRNMSDEVVRAMLIDKLGLEKVRLLMPTDPSRDFAPAPGLDLKGIDHRILRLYNGALKPMQFKPSPFESNNWVVSGARSKSGQPLLASDPHRAITLPALRYLVHLNAPGWNVIGAGEPALPGVALGHNERIAWGVTIVGTDQSDLFVYDVPKKGDATPIIRIIVEPIRVKGEQAPRKIELNYTRHGPIIFSDDKRWVALKWAGSEPGGAGYLGGLAVSRAQNKDQFLKALESWKIPGLNFIYADMDGNIGWVAAALTPIRPKHDGLLPVPASGGFDWQGYLPVKDLPQSFNPKSGWLATANHNILPADYKHQIGYEFAAPYRFLRVKHNLESADKFDLADFQKFQHDAVSIPGPRLAKLLTGLFFGDAKTGRYAKIMRDWDGQLARDSQAAVIYAHWLPELQNAVHVLFAPKDLVKEVAAKSGLPTLLQALEHPNEQWFGPADPANARDFLVTQSFQRAAETIQKRWPNPDTMRWGALHTATFRHPLAALDPTLAKSFNVGPFERTGDANTPNNTRYGDDFQQIHGATYRHLFDLADWDKGLATSAPGQSGQPGSPHYGDLAPLWAEGRYFPLAYSRTKVEEVTKSRLWLRPGN